MISAVVIAKNEAKHIENCLLSLANVITDIIVVDAESEDTTRDIAHSIGARVLIKPWEGYGAARNYGALLAKNPWILSIDADEVIDADLKNEITHLNPERGNVYSFKRINHHGKRPIQYGWLSPEWKKRLYHRDDWKWSNRPVHEELIAETSSSIVKKKGVIHHYSFENITELQEKMSHYAKLTAEAWRLERHIPGRLHVTLGPYWHFIRAYIFKLGILEGKPGWLIAKEAFRYSQKKYQYLKQTATTHYK